MRIRCSRVLMLSAVSVVVAGPFATPLRAQTRPEPIYPAYEGFLKNPDGTLTLSFGYFSHNGEPVTLSPGPSNSFAPDPADRLQPTTFLPGHRQFQCTMIVGPNFDGKLRWTLSYAGISTPTSERMLLYSWELDEDVARQVLRGIDLSAPPKGVCLNRPPVVRVLGLPRRFGAAGAVPSGFTVTLPQELRLFGSVRDEGLPRTGQLTVAWKKLSGPGTVTFADPKAARTRATFSAPGRYQLELWASDSERESRTEVTVTVNSAP